MYLGTSWLAVDAGGGQRVGRGRRWDVWLGHAGMCGSPTWQRLGQHPSVRRAFEVPEAAGWAPWHMAIFCTFRGLAPRLAALGAPPDIRRVFCGDWGGALLRFGRAEAGESGGSLSDIIISLKGCPGFTCFFAPTSQQDPRGGEGARISQPFFLPPPCAAFAAKGNVPGRVWTTF